MASLLPYIMADAVGPVEIGEEELEFLFQSETR
jgi:hypothetical protein